VLKEKNRGGKFSKNCRGKKKKSTEVRKEKRGGGKLDLIYIPLSGVWTKKAIEQFSSPRKGEWGGKPRAGLSARTWGETKKKKE